MSYNKRTYNNTNETITYEDMNRIENGIEANDKLVTQHEKQINVLSSMLEVQYINSGTHTLADYREQGIYCFTSGCTITDIPVGKNGWLIVLPTNLKSPNAKQIWMRWGTAGSNSWMTYERIISGGTVGEWTQYATTTITEIPFPFNEGFSEYVSNTWNARIYKNGNKAMLKMSVIRENTDVFTQNTNFVVGVLPVGYRPKNNFSIACRCEKSGAISYFGYASIYGTNGNVQVNCNGGIDANKIHFSTNWYECV